MARAAKVLGHLTDRAEAGPIGLSYFDECSFAPSPPTGSSRCPPAQRKPVRYEYLQGRRVDSLATSQPCGDAPRLSDIALIHGSKAVKVHKESRPGIDMDFLPPDGRGLSRIEPVKHHQISPRGHEARVGLRLSVAGGSGTPARKFDARNILKTSSFVDMID